MGVSTQKLLITIIAINLFIGFVTEIYYLPRDVTYSTSEQLLAYEVNNLELNRQRFDSENEIHNPASSDFILGDNTFGNAINMGSILFNSFLRGLAPLPVSSNEVSSIPEKIFAYGLNIFKGYMYLLILLEAYFVYKNKKTS